MRLLRGACPETTERDSSTSVGMTGGEGFAMTLDDGFGMKEGEWVRSE